MKILELTCGEKVLLDDEDYNRIPHTGWYLTSKKHERHERKTRYVTHDSYGRLHRYILGLSKDDSAIVDHIDGNGLNNQKNNLRIVNNLINKRNQSTVRNNKFNFNGIHYENAKNRSPRIRCVWSEGESLTKTRRAQFKTKSWSFSKYSPEEALKQAVLWRIQKMKENEYFIDERSTTIEKELLNNPNADIAALLGIDLEEVLK